MQVLRPILAVAVAVVVAAGVFAADPAQKAAKKGVAVRGVIVAVEKDADAKAATITVKTNPGKKNPDAKPEEKKFKVTDTTKIEKIEGTLKDGEAKPATLTDLAKDLQVVVQVKDEAVQSVKILQKKKKK